MSSEPLGEQVEAPVADERKVDLTGRDRMARNVLTSWAAQLVFVVAGFVMPRMTDQRLGQEALGVWDFAWSLVVYFGLAAGGVISSVNRFVAKHQTVGDTDGVNRAVASVTCVLLVMGMLAAVLTVAAALLLPDLLSNRLGNHTGDAQWVVLLLGFSLTIHIGGASFGGVITGCHRWGVYNAIHGGGYALTVAGMIIALLLGGGLPYMALMNLLGEVVALSARVVVAYHVYPGLHVRLSLARWQTARSMLAFGGKSFVPMIAEVLLNQTVSVLIVAHLGPAALALYSRPLSLVKNIRSFVQRFAFVLTPTASSLQAVNREGHLQNLMIQGARYGAYIALPPSIALAILGTTILHIWMGPRYSEGVVLAILALGYLPMLIQLPTMSILLGMNLHGRPGLANLVSAIAAVGLGFAALGPLQWGLVGAAASVTLPLLFASGVYLPVYACRQLKLPIRKYVIKALLGPVLCGVPFALSLVAARLLFADNPLACLASAGIVGGGILAVLYWQFVLPPSVKHRMSKWIGLKAVKGDLVTESLHRPAQKPFPDTTIPAEQAGSNSPGET